MKKNLLVALLVSLIIFGCTKKKQTKQKPETTESVLQKELLSSGLRQLKNKRFSTAVNTFKQLKTKFKSTKHDSLYKKALALQDSLTMFNTLKNYKNIFSESPLVTAKSFLANSIKNHNLITKKLAELESFEPNIYKYSIHVTGLGSDCLNLLHKIQTSSYACNLRNINIVMPDKAKTKNNILSLRATVEFYFLKSVKNIESKNFFKLANFVNNTKVFSSIIYSLKYLNNKQIKPYMFYKKQNKLLVGFWFKSYQGNALSFLIRKSEFYNSGFKNLVLKEQKTKIINGISMDDQLIELDIIKQPKIHTFKDATETIKNGMNKFIYNPIKIEEEVFNNYWPELQKTSWVTDFKKNLKIKAVVHDKLDVDDEVFLSYKNKLHFSMKEGDVFRQATLIFIDNRKIKFAKEKEAIWIYVPKKIREKKTGQKKKVKRFM